MSHMECGISKSVYSIVWPQRGFVDYYICNHVMKCKICTRHARYKANNTLWQHIRIINQPCSAASLRFGHDRRRDNFECVPRAVLIVCLHIPQVAHHLHGRSNSDPDQGRQCFGAWYVTDRHSAVNAPKNRVFACVFAGRQMRWWSDGKACEVANASPPVPLSTGRLPWTQVQRWISDTTLGMMCGRTVQMRGGTQGNKKLAAVSVWARVGLCGSTRKQKRHEWKLYRHNVMWDWCAS